MRSTISPAPLAGAGRRVSLTIARRESMDRGRLEAFSDGVFAVALTLLAFNLVIAGPGHGPLLNQLGTNWPSFVSYVFSFGTIGVICVNHHMVMQNVAAVDLSLLFVNHLLLPSVVLIQYSTPTS